MVQFRPACFLYLYAYTLRSNFESFLLSMIASLIAQILTNNTMACDLAQEPCKKNLNQGCYSDHKIFHHSHKIFTNNNKKKNKIRWYLLKINNDWNIMKWNSTYCHFNWFIKSKKLLDICFGKFGRMNKHLNESDVEKSNSVGKSNLVEKRPQSPHSSVYHVLKNGTYTSKMWQI